MFLGCRQMAVWASESKIKIFQKSPKTEGIDKVLRRQITALKSLSFDSRHKRRSLEKIVTRQSTWNKNYASVTRDPEIFTIIDIIFVAMTYHQIEARIIYLQK